MLRLYATAARRLSLLASKIKNPKVIFPKWMDKANANFTLLHSLGSGIASTHNTHNFQCK